MFDSTRGAELFSYLERADVLSLQALGALHGLEFNLLVFLKSAESGALDGAEVRKHVGTAVGRSDETKALLVVEPLHGSCCHAVFFLSFKLRVSPHDVRDGKPLSRVSPLPVKGVEVSFYVRRISSTMGQSNVLRAESPTRLRYSMTIP